jgi:[acyl-carrier-protein] S-malonyltransferase
MTTTKKLAFLFPGQGAQYVGMGKDFYTQYAEARLVFEEADDLLSQKLTDTIFSASESELTQTKNSQPAIFVVSLAILRVLQKLFGEFVPAACAGLSLGEYSALVASGYASFQDALSVVQKRGLFMHQACEEIPGTMAVVLGLDDAAVETLVAACNLPNDLWTANFNCPGQVVISGTKKGIETATPYLLENGAKRVMPLQVHGAFHSGLMQPAKEKLKPYIDACRFTKGHAKLAMNTPGDFVEAIDQVKTYLINQVTNPVRWHRAVRAIDASGVALFCEIGCGKTLAGMNKRIGLQAPTVSIEKVEDIQALEKALLETVQS